MSSETKVSCSVMINIENDQKQTPRAVNRFLGLTNEQGNIFDLKSAPALSFNVNTRGKTFGNSKFLIR